VAAWQWVLAWTGVGCGPLVLGFLGWAWFKSTRPDGDQ